MFTLPAAVFVALLVLKLTHNLDMSWVWVVTSPVWSLALFFLGIIAVPAAIAAVTFAVTFVTDSFKRGYRRARRIFK